MSRSAASQSDVGRAKVAVSAEPASDRHLHQASVQIAAELSLSLAHEPSGRDHDLLLVVTPEQLELRVIRAEPDLVGGHPIAIDLAKLDTTSGAGRSLQQPLLKAVGLRKGDPTRPNVIDTTAGFGEDAWLLASAGCHVVAIEREPIIAALLGDALRRAGTVSPDTVQRICVGVGDSIELLSDLARDAIEPPQTAPDWLHQFRTPDVIYIDTMFPPGRKTLERKPMRVLRKLTGDATDTDERELLDVALTLAQRRVVVKRPTKAPPLAGRVPAASHKGKGVRYDVYPAIKKER